MSAAEDASSAAYYSSVAHEKGAVAKNEQLSLLINHALLRSASTTAHNAANALFSETNTPMVGTEAQRCACAFCGACPALVMIPAKQTEAGGDGLVRACGQCVQRRNPGESRPEHVELGASGLLERCIAALEEQRTARHSSGAMSVDSGTGELASATTSSSGGTLRSRPSAACAGCRRRPPDETPSACASLPGAAVRCSMCDESLCAACAYQHRVAGCAATPSGPDAAHDIFDVFDTGAPSKRSPGARAHHDGELDAELGALSVSSGALSGAASSGVNSNARNTPSKSLSLSAPTARPYTDVNGLTLHREREREPSGGSAPQSPGPALAEQRSLAFCERHRGEPVRMYCRTCDQLVCQVCLFNDEQRTGDLQRATSSVPLNGHCQHDLQLLATAIESQTAAIRTANQEVRTKLAEVRQMFVALQQTSTRLVVHFQQSQTQIDEAAALLARLAADRRAELQRMLDAVYQSRATSISSVMHCTQDQLEKLQQHADFVDKLLVAAANPQNPNRGIELLMLHKCIANNFSTLRDAMPELTRQYSSLVNTCTPPASQMAAPHNAAVCFPELDYIVDEKLLHTGVAHLLGSLRLAPAAQPCNTQLAHLGNGADVAARASCSDIDQVDGVAARDRLLLGSMAAANCKTERARTASGQPAIHLPGTQKPATTPSSATAPRLSASASAHTLNAPASVKNGNAAAPRHALANELGLGKWNLNVANLPVTNANGSLVNAANLQTLAALHAAGVDLSAMNSAEQRDLVAQLQQAEASAKLGIPLPQLVLNSVMNAAGNAHLGNGAPMLRSTIKRTKMIFHVKFGEFGVLNGQFTEPSGVAVSLSNEIIVADTNNHRIQVFDSEGRFKFQFGECGKRDSQLLYPNRVAVSPVNGDIVVTERCPTHQIQIYSHTGQFLRKFGANVLQHPRGVTVDNQGRILVVECKVMRILIFDQFGNLISKFGCSKYLEFPNAIAVNDKEEIFISDNRAHCVKVFDYQGHFLRQVGGEGVTNYPIGVTVSPAGEILVADNHNNFNLTVFNAEGELIAALESKVKHAQCFDIALLRDASDSIVLASKDYRLYVYRYKDPMPVSD